MSRRLEPKSVLFINRVVAPAPGATGQLLGELADELRDCGWRVSVLAPNSNVGANLLRRAFAFLLLYPQLLWRALRLPRHDVVVSMTDPPMLVVLGALVSLVKGCSHVHWAQDLYPEVAEELGVLRKGGILANVLRQLSTWCMKRAQGVVAIGDCMKQRLIKRGVLNKKITVVPNWGLGSETPQAEEVTQFRHEFGLENKFVAMYSGNLGLAHCFESILDAAESLQREASILFVFVGGGSRLSWIQEQVRERKIRNVRFLPAQPRERLATMLAAADLHLASMRHELCGLVVPSKVYGALAAGRPCFFVGPRASEAAQILLRHNGGCVFDVRDGAALAGSIARWAKGGALLRQFNNALQSIAPQFRVGPAAEAFAAVLDGAVQFRSDRRQEVVDLFRPSLNSQKIGNLLTSVATDPKS